MTKYGQRYLITYMNNKRATDHMEQSERTNLGVHRVQIN
jgi:hypothetical protein